VGRPINRLSRVIDRQGQISLPEAGVISIAGMTIEQAQNSIQKALAAQFRNEKVEISLGRLRSIRIYVVGDVQRPGSYDVSSLSTPLNALCEAGGPTSHGSLRTLKQYRGEKLVREIDLYDFLLHGVRSEVDRLMPGDTILVPPVGAQVRISGMVRRPAIYELKNEKSLDEALNLAGGVEVTANVKKIEVERVEAHERRTMISLELDAKNPQGFSGYRVQDGDQIRVAAILPYNEQAVYLEGHVYRPGPYAYHDGMTLADLLPSYQAVMPEPNNHAEIVRLRAPDFRPETISISLPDVLTGNVQINLKPFDVVRVYGRYEVDSPKVSIRGEVLRPGDYPLSQGLTLAGLVQMAGGLKRSAYNGVADLSSYVIQGDQKVVTENSAVALDKALAGDKGNDPVLKPGDVVGIRQITGWQDIGSSVTIDGEVVYAGIYGVGQGERLSSVLKRAGGFRAGAFPAGAILERVQVRELAERNRQEIIRRIEETVPNVAAGAMSSQEQQSMMQSMQMQRQQVLISLKSHPAKGRQVIRISEDISRWENTAADIELRAGDKLFIPKQPNFVMVSGQVYNSAAISYTPGRDARWYLNRAGGVTQSGKKSAVYVVRADGSVVGHGGRWFSGDAKSVRLKPGDAIVVPEKIIGGSMAWRNLMSVAQIISATAITGAAAGAF
jgi:protein involved in polysaccharide export with SLBB domain